MDVELLKIPEVILRNMESVWTFLLLVTRFSAIVMLLPGVGVGAMGMAVRYPAALVLAFAAFSTSKLAALPENLATLLVQAMSEFLFGTLLAIVPLMIVSGVHTAGQLASTAMGLQPSQLVDPTTQVPLADISRILGDLTIVLFLYSGAHHAVLYAAAGMGSEIVPGSFLLGAQSIGAVIDRSARIFELGVMLSAPVIVALLLTNFVLGMVTKAVPSVNVFIVSFPLTIAIGIVLTLVSLPELVTIIPREFIFMESQIMAIASDSPL